MNKLVSSILALFGITAAACSADVSEQTMKEIVYRGGLIRFQIPENWAEVYGVEGGGMFYGDGPDAGTLRLDVITAKSPKNLGPEETVELIKGVKGVDEKEIRHLPNGNAMASQIIRTREGDTPITIFWWHVSNFVPPNHVRLANFSYTVLTSQEKAEETKSEVQMLAEAIEMAEFHSAIGN